MIYCCGTYFSPDEIYFLRSAYPYKDRVLEILRKCTSKNEQCDSYIAELTQTDQRTNTRVKIREKNRRARRFMKPLLEELDYIYKMTKSGTNSNMNWKYGENKEIKNRKGQVVEIRQKSTDFNGVKTLIKQIYLPLKEPPAQI